MENPNKKQEVVGNLFNPPDSKRPLRTIDDRLCLVLHNFLTQKNPEKGQNFLDLKYLLADMEGLVGDFSALAEKCSVLNWSLSDHDISSGGGRLTEVMEFKVEISRVGAFLGFLSRMMAVFEVFYLKGMRRRHGLTTGRLSSQELQAEYLTQIDQTAGVFFDFLTKINSSKLLPEDNNLFEECSNRLFNPTPERGTIIFGRHISGERTFFGFDILLENNPQQISKDLNQLRSLLESGQISQEVFIESLTVFLERILADYMAVRMAVCKIDKNTPSAEKVSANILLRKINLFLDSFARNGKIEIVRFRAFADLENKINSYDEFTNFHANSLPELALLLRLIFDIVHGVKRNKNV